MTFQRSNLSQLLAADAFWWAVGIENSFVTTPWPQTGRTMDEYELTDHYNRWHEDIGLMAELGIRYARYGVPWHRINPAPGVWDWEWSDRALNRVLDCGINPIVDLVHYGLPLWMEGAFLHPDFPQHMAEFSARLAERFKGRIHLWTPLNEPRITAWFCGKVGVWPPNKHGWTGFVQVLTALCRGMLATHDALLRVDPQNVIAHVDASNYWLPPQPDEPLLYELTDFRKNIVYLALDLITGKVTPEHQLWNWLGQHGFDASTQQWFAENAREPDVIGINLYPMLSQKQYVRTASGRIRIRFPHGNGQMMEHIVEEYWRRYHKPMFIAETAGRGAVKRRMKWLQESVVATRKLRSRGVSLVGYTWWPMFDLIAWAYRQGRGPLGNYVVPMGLWSLDRENLDRVHTPLVDAFRELVAHGPQTVGEIIPPSY